MNPQVAQNGFIIDGLGLSGLAFAYKWLKLYPETPILFRYLNAPTDDLRQHTIADPVQPEISWPVNSPHQKIFLKELGLVWTPDELLPTDFQIFSLADGLLNFLDDGRVQGRPINAIMSTPYGQFDFFGQDANPTLPAAKIWSRKLQEILDLWFGEQDPDFYELLLLLIQDLWLNSWEIKNENHVAFKQPLAQKMSLKQGQKHPHFARFKLLQQIFAHSLWNPTEAEFLGPLLNFISPPQKLVCFKKPLCVQTFMWESILTFPNIRYLPRNTPPKNKEFEKAALIGNDFSSTLRHPLTARLTDTHLNAKNFYQGSLEVTYEINPNTPHFSFFDLKAGAFWDNLSTAVYFKEPKNTIFWQCYSAEKKNNQLLKLKLALLPEISSQWLKEHIEKSLWQNLAEGYSLSEEQYLSCVGNIKCAVNWAPLKPKTSFKATPTKLSVKSRVWPKHFQAVCEPFAPSASSPVEAARRAIYLGHYFTSK